MEVLADKVHKQGEHIPQHVIATNHPYISTCSSGYSPNVSSAHVHRQNGVQQLSPRSKSARVMLQLHSKQSAVSNTTLFSLQH